MKRAALYVRVSTAEQRDKGLSVDSQIEALKAFCEDKGYSIAGIYNDAGISARKRYTKRPALLQLCADCEQGKVDIILFTKLDRWFRSVADYYQVQTILDQAKVPWRAIWEDYETETSAGQFKVNIMLSVAQAESDRTSERIRAVNDYRRARGDYIGTAPIGFKYKRGVGLVRDKDTEKGVDAFFRTYLKTFSNIDAINAAGEQGLIIRRNQAIRFLRNHHYAEYDAYITEAEYNTIQKAIQTRRTRSPKDNRVYMFAGLLRCKECGHNLGSTCRTQASKRRYNYYRCNSHLELLCNNKRTLSELMIEKELLRTIDNALEEYTISAQAKANTEDNTMKIRRLESRIARIGDRYENDEISKADYTSKVNAIRQEIATLSTPVISPALTELPSDWQDTYVQLDSVHKKQFWNRILDHIELTDYDNMQIFF